jgi:rhodanese-related sulfurtransferase
MSDAIDGDRLLHARWQDRLDRDQRGAPLLTPLFVAEQGRAVHIVDIRPPDVARGVMGAIPGSVFLETDRLEEIAQTTPRDLPIVVVSGDGVDAASVALRLEKSGLQRAAAMAGGLAAWRAVGLGTSRAPAQASDSLPDRSDSLPLANGALSIEQVRDHVGDPRSVRWIKLASLVTHERFSCVDGRDERSVIGTPGGDAGEFLLALAAWEQTMGRRLDEPTVRNALLASLDHLGAFYMHTDGHAFDALIERVRSDSRLQTMVARITEPEEWGRFFIRPPEEAWDALEEHMTDPAHVGCGHMRLMLEHSDDYGIRRELVVFFLGAFCRLMWAGAPELTLTLLPGGHKEGAVVNVRMEEEIFGLSRIPLLSPACSAGQMFVNHPGVSSYLRQAVVELHKRGLGGLRVDASKGGDFEAAFSELAERHIERTVGTLAKGLPVYDVEFSRAGSFDVREAGFVS